MKTIYLVIIIVLIFLATIFLVLFYNQKLKNIEEKNNSITNELNEIKQYSYEIQNINNKTDSLKKGIIENDIEIGAIQKKINELRLIKYQQKSIDIDLLEAKKTLGIL